MTKKSGFEVMCVYCKAKKLLTHAEARALSEPPMCEKDGGVMVVFKVHA